MKYESSETTVAIVGLGLLGSSIALNLKIQNERSKKYHIIGISRKATIETALEQGLINEGYDYADIAQWKPRADLIILCTPIVHITGFMKMLAEDKSPFAEGAVITDVGSTKREICTLGIELFPGTDPLFIGSHPMAGSEKTGISAQESTLYENSYWLLCPPAHANESDYSKLTDLVTCLGSRIVTLDATEHDLTMSKLSHSVQIISSALACSLGEQTDIPLDSLTLAGRAFRDMTRIAASGYDMWESIFKTNREATYTALTQFEQTLAQFKECLKSDSIDEDNLKRLFSRGAEVRSHVSNPGKGFSQGLSEIIVTMEDMPGMISNIVTPLSEKGINIRDIELLKVREGVGGTLLLGFDTEPEAKKAQNILSGKNIQSRMR